MWTGRPTSEESGVGTSSERVQEFDQVRLLRGGETQPERAERPVPFNSTSLAVTAW